jgi:hypothetical protein
MSNKEIDSAYALIQGMQSTDPRLSEAMKIILRNLGNLYITEQRTRDTLSGLVNPPENPKTFQARLLFRAIELSWSPASGALFYEVREGNYDNWNDASFVIRVGNTRVELPPRLAGQYTFLLKSYNVASEPSEEWAYVNVSISPIPALTVTAQVIDNNVLLDWTEPVHPFEIVNYRITRNGVDIGYVAASFFVYFENTAGIYRYGVRAVDIAGNESVEDFVETFVNQPPDFELEDTYLSNLQGTKLNCYSNLQPVLIAIINTTETWTEHFVNNGWDSPQDQIDAGWPYYAQPNLNNGYYEEVHDFGTLFASVIINIAYQIALISDTVLVQTLLSHSEDGITFTPYVTASTIFAASFRYVKFKLEFTGADYNDLANISNIIVTIQVKRVMDSGRATVLASDVGGTQVNFTTAFRDIDSITLTPLSTTEQVAIYDFQDVLDPVGFKILLFSNTGVRINGEVSWKARGVM